MNDKENLEKKARRLGHWTDRINRICESELDSLTRLYQKASRHAGEEMKRERERLVREEEQTKAQLDQAGKDFAQKKYKLERGKADAESVLEKAEAEFGNIQKKGDRELVRITESQTNIQLSFDRQMRALRDLYEEKRSQLLITKEKLARHNAEAEKKVRDYKAEVQTELSRGREEAEKRLSTLKNQAESRREGWTLALEKLTKELKTLDQEKEHTLKRLSTIHDEKEKELTAARIAMEVAKEQLELDKATLIEKAEEDQRQCETRVKELRDDLARSENELQELTVKKEKEKSDSEEAYAREETLLKETVKTESDKRDFEGKLFEQEKNQKEKELNRLKEEYEKKKWHWDNQIRNLMMQKSLQDSEHDAVRMRVDREARACFRSLEAKRDELKQRLSDVKSRHASLVAHGEKESELLEQRWKWRKERIWTMWRNRLDVLKKERDSIGEQLNALLESFSKNKQDMGEQAKRSQAQIDNLQQFILQMTDKGAGERKQREIQIELEKTRLIAQIKECESLIEDWMDRLKLSQSEVETKKKNFGVQMDFLDRLYRDEERESELFLHQLKSAITSLEGELINAGVNQKAA